MKIVNVQFCILTILSLAVCSGCSNHAERRAESNSDAKLSGAISYNQTNHWSPDTTNLDQAAINNPSLKGLKNDVERFYELLHKKDWESAYEFRSKAFKKDFPKNLYLSLAKGEGEDWGLSNYSILSVNTYDSNYATVICKFIELPGPLKSYSAVDWHKENDGVWRCDGAGPDKLTIFISTRSKH